MYGTALSATQLNATASVPGTFVYTPAAGDGPRRGRRADAVGDVHADRRGELHAATATVAITVTKATPTITWATPADIVYGTALSATQLNATASVPGTFVYTPAAGTVLNAGVGADAVGDLHADRRGELHDRDGDVAITVTKATPTITWAAPADIVYGTALERDAVERDGERAGHVRLHARRRARC